MIQTMNILLTSAGRRTYMVDYFKKALSGGGLVFAANSTMSPALYNADGYVITPLIYDSGYIPFLRDFCKKNDIRLIVPLFDIDLPVLARHREEFLKEGIFVLVSDKETVDSCNDKYGMYLKLWRAGIRCPHTEISLSQAKLAIKAMTMSYPVMIKPRFGMGSIGILKAYNRDELKAFYESCKRSIGESYLKYESKAYADECVLIQEMREGNEYGLDIINDLDKNFVTAVIKKKLSMRAGETDEAIILGPSDEEYETLYDLSRSVSDAFGHIGNMDVDVIMNPDNMCPYVIDMNARFGGGYPFSHLAGLDLPRAVVEWLENGKADPACFNIVCHTHGYKDMVIRNAQRQ